MAKLKEREKSQIISLFMNGTPTGIIAEKTNIPEYKIVNFLEDSNLYYEYKNRICNYIEREVV